MDVFDIRMLPESAGSEYPGYRRCQIRMGSFCESFLADMTLWSDRMYENQWLTALKYIADHEKSALVASFGEDHVRWWAIYRNGDSVIVQEHLRFRDELGVAFDPSRVEEYVPSHVAVSEDGEPISEWYVERSAIKEFLRVQSERVR